MSKNFRIKQAVHIAITCGAVSGFIFTGSAVAAEQSQIAPSATTTVSSASTTANLQAVQVTGTMIRRTDVEQSQPIQIVTSAQIQASGLPTIGDVLQQITSSGAALNSLSNTSGGFGYIASGATNVDLRYLGANRTLVLVNGHRWSTSIDGTVNLETIPSSIIDHIEILQDGASAIYGSEAISGVVNIITVKNFTGAEVNAYQGIHNGDGHWDGLTSHDSITIGTSGAHGGVVFNASYMNQDGISAEDRALTSVPVFGAGLTRGSSSTPQGRFVFTAPGAGSPSSPNNVIAPSTGLTQADCPTKNFGSASAPEYYPLCSIQVTPGTPGTSPSDFEPFNNDVYNYAPSNYAMTPLQVTGIYVAGHYDLADNLTLSMTGTSNHRVSNQQAAPLVNNLGANSNITFKPGDEYYPFNFPISTTGTPATGLLESINRRYTENGDRKYIMTENMNHLNAQLSGFFDAGSSEWDWTAGGSYSKDNLLVQAFGLVNASYLQIQLDPAQCSALPPSAGCVPINYFGGQTAPMSPEQVAFASYNNQNTFTTSMQDLYANISTSDIVDLPAGPLGFAAGLERTANTGDYEPDAIEGHLLTNGTPIVPTSGSESSKSAFVEFDIPLLANVPFSRLLDLDVASRYTQVKVLSNTVHNTSSRAGLKWQPAHDLLIRASWSQGFRSPDISELFAGKTSTVPLATDPCNAYLTSGVPAAVQQRCEAAGVPPSYSQVSDVLNQEGSGNPSLQPEKSISKTIGFVFSPSSLPGFNANLDYYHIELTNSIQSGAIQTILNECYLEGVASQCAKITRESNGSGNIKEVADPIINIGGTITSGFDLGFTYALPTTAIGQFEIGLQGTYINKYSEFFPNATGEGFNVENLLGRERGGSVLPTGIPRWKANGNVTWTRGNWKAEWRIRYIGSMTENCSDYYDNTPNSFANLGVCSEPDFTNNAFSQNYLGKTLYHDVQVNYTISPLNTTFTFGINNVFNKQPPNSTTIELNSFDPTLYPVPGRFYYASIGVKF